MLLPGRLNHECVCVKSESKFCYTCVFLQRRVILLHKILQCHVCVMDNFKLTLMSEVEDSILVLQRDTWLHQHQCCCQRDYNHECV